MFADAFLVGSGIFLEPDFRVVRGAAKLLLGDSQQFHSAPTGCPQGPGAGASGDVLGFLYPVLVF